MSQPQKDTQKPNRDNKKPETQKVDDVKQLAIFEPNKTKKYVRRLPYKNWAITLTQTRSNLVITIYETQKKKTYTRLNILLSDLKYVQKLLEDLSHELRKIGLESTFF